jgi:hypothetical protein
MVTTPKSTKPAAATAEIATAPAEPDFKTVANAAIDNAAFQLGVDAKNRYKVQRAFGFIAMQLAIKDGSMDSLISAVVQGAGDLPAGFGLEAPAKKDAAL